MSAAIVIEGLTKRYRAGLRMRTVNAVASASFEVKRGEVFGFVGPNGAGKTTTIRAILGLIRPTSGSITVLGTRMPDRAVRAKIGFLPESPYFYDYLSARELVDLAGRLAGLGRAERRRRGDVLLERVGLARDADRPMRKYSKGMLQRAGLAQALVHEPEVVILDEPMSGLDPVGRKDVRDIILELRDAGRTVFFSTHIIPDVEAICDRVGFIVGGRVVDVGPVADLLGAKVLGTDVVLRADDAALAALPLTGERTRRVGDLVTVALGADADVGGFLRVAAAQTMIVSVTPRKESLEELFLRWTTSEEKSA
ncbi:MAG: ABC transporter ATP-binding protein [Myxococcales bacterium]|nr:ABC transporter ATP-binding protein [Myxococcales bacterium]